MDFANKDISNKVGVDLDVVSDVSEPVSDYSKLDRATRADYRKYERWAAEANKVLNMK